MTEAQILQGLEKFSFSVEAITDPVFFRNHPGGVVMSQTLFSCDMMRKLFNEIKEDLTRVYMLKNAEQKNLSESEFLKSSEELNQLEKKLRLVGADGKETSLFLEAGETRCPTTRVVVLETDMQSAKLFFNCFIIAVRNTILQEPTLCFKNKILKEWATTILEGLNTLSAKDIHEAELVLENLQEKLKGLEKWQIEALQIWGINADNAKIKTVDEGKGADYNVIKNKLQALGPVPEIPEIIVSAAAPVTIVTASSMESEAAHPPHSASQAQQEAQDLAIALSMSEEADPSRTINRTSEADEELAFALSASLVNAPAPAQSDLGRAMEASQLDYYYQATQTRGTNARGASNQITTSDREKVHSLK